LFVHPSAIKMPVTKKNEVTFGEVTSGSGDGNLHNWGQRDVKLLDKAYIKLVTLICWKLGISPLYQIGFSKCVCVCVCVVCVCVCVYK
jgi:hypothetical protein